MARAVHVEKPEKDVCCRQGNQEARTVCGEASALTPVEFCSRMTEPAKPDDMFLAL